MTNSQTAPTSPHLLHANTCRAARGSDTWRDAVPGRSYRAALRARSDEAISEWSEWSESRFCISEPGHARATGGERGGKVFGLMCFFFWGMLWEWFVV